ncbi:MAG: hypothetical protein WKF97_18475 [Chitinophagaceae bacterium]
MQDAKQQAKWIRHFRWLHRKIAIVLFSFFLLIAISGFLLGWKKNTGLLAPTQTGSSAELSAWLPVDSLASIAVRLLHDLVSPAFHADHNRLLVMVWPETA